MASADHIYRVQLKNLHPTHRPPEVPNRDPRRRAWVSKALSGERYPASDIDFHPQIVAAEAVDKARSHMIWWFGNICLIQGVSSGMGFFQRNKALLGLGAAAGLVVAGVLAFGVFGIQTLFTEKTVDEDGPTFSSGATVADPAISSAAEPADAANAPEDPADAPEPRGTDDESSQAPSEADEAEDDDLEAEQDDSAPVVERIASASFEDSEIHSGSGDAVVLSDGIQQFLRFEENFATDNGPDLNVYLRAPDGSFIDLGDLKGNIGSQNYEIPDDVDVATFNTIDIWCVRFGVSFSMAVLA